MTVTTKKAQVYSIIACSPPKPGVGVAPAIIYAVHCGADKILAMGGSMNSSNDFCLFGLKVNILVGPGNQFVAAAGYVVRTRWY